MGGAEEVPLIREGLSNALKTIKGREFQSWLQIWMEEPVWDVNLKGALALILGGESKGVSPTLQKTSAIQSFQCRYKTVGLFEC